jgi:hypothetical protein
MRHIAIWGLSGCTTFHLINGTIFVQKYTEHKKRVLIFSKNLTEQFLIQRYMIIALYGSSGKVADILVIFY